MPAGRPPLYSEIIAEAICDGIAEGRSLREITSDPDMPSYGTVYNWLKDPSKSDFINAYSLAHKIQLAREADEIKDIADSCGSSRDEIAKATLQIQVRKWRLSKLDSKKYGDRPEQEENRITTQDLSALSATELELFLLLISKINKGDDQ